MGLSSDRQQSAKVALHIDEIVLTGTGVIDRVRLRQTLEAELTRLLSARAIDAVQMRNRSRERLDLGSLRLSHPVRAEALGKHLAGKLGQFLSARSTAMPAATGAANRGSRR